MNVLGRKAIAEAGDMQALGEFSMAEGEFLAAIKQATAAHQARNLRDLIEQFGDVDDLADL